MGLICLLILVVAMISSIWPTQEEWFFGLGLLGKDQTADGYFANGSSNVEVGALNSWFIYVHNHMGTEQNVNIKAKLLSSAMELPDDQNHLPSNVTAFAEFPLSLSVNETVVLPFFWTIMQEERQNNSNIINSLVVNNKQFKVGISDSASSFVLVFELWVQNSDIGADMFGWESRNGLSSASINMGFKVYSNATN